MRHGKQTAAFFLAAAMVMGETTRQLYSQKTCNQEQNRKQCDRSFSRIRAYFR